MRRKQNVIIFSAGESVRNGNVGYIRDKLQKKDIVCFDWRDLFEKAHDSENIALLPSLAKKIPTFDFALIVAEAVDMVKFRGDNEQSAMRDNVIFELGLCVMALGVERVILLAEEGVRLPEDLVGVGKIGVEYVQFNSTDVNESIDKVGEIIRDRSEDFAKGFERQLDQIINHINKNSEMISPVFVGAAVSSAEAYFLNFIIRLLENIDKGFLCQDRQDEGVHGFPNKFEIIIVIPTSVDSLTRTAIGDYYKRECVESFLIKEAGTRGLYFNGIYDQKENLLKIVDIPTSITASYAVVNSVLNIDSDDDYDTFAEERFVTKEMDIYAFALNKLLSPIVAEKRLSFIRDEQKKKTIIEHLKNVKVEIMDIENLK